MNHPLDDDLYAKICRAQDRFRAPHQRWRWAWQPPIPFRWGPNGSLILFGLLAAAVAALITTILFLRGLA